MDLVTKDGYNYKFNPTACESCGGACCTGESGYIWVKYQEIEKMAQFLELTIEEFATMYLRKVKHRYSIIEKKIDTDNYACIFFDNNIKQCTIYPVRPLQCRTFPFWEIFKKDIEEVKKECPGIID
ncbi:MAG TPA: YkgJ family cysteine cluster protein [Campylobacterales bacterium]|nr:YkgJ family cysteine cluster protein [Campylobacterales bacterium]HHD80943.1 YkgJ family cysteine cluster protein [Campylobacterales bacterium]